MDGYLKTLLTSILINYPSTHILLKGIYYILLLDGSFFSHFKNKKCIGGAQKELFKRILKIEFGHILKEY